MGLGCECDVCVDVDECSDKADDCDVNADCTNTDGSFYCTCRSGFEGNGRSCKGDQLSFTVR